MRYITVFLSARELDGVYRQEIEKLGELMAEAEIGLVYGAANKGLMGILAGMIQSKGGLVVGITIKELEEAVLKEDCTEIVVASSLLERKELLLSRSDAIMATVGGGHWMR